MIKYRIELTEEERKRLEDIINKGNHSSSQFKDALILLNCDVSKNAEKKYTNQVISDIVNVSMRTIDRTKKLFVEEGLDAVFEPKKPNREYPKIVDGDVEAHLIALCCGKSPEGSAKWSLRLLADKMVELKYVENISHETVRKVLKKTNLSLGKQSDG